MLIEAARISVVEHMVNGWHLVSIALPEDVRFY